MCLALFQALCYLAVIALFIKCADRRRVGGTHLKRLQHFRNEVVYFFIVFVSRLLSSSTRDGSVHT